jgi:hypothetical protein
VITFKQDLYAINFNSITPTVLKWLWFRFASRALLKSRMGLFSTGYFTHHTTLLKMTAFWDIAPCCLEIGLQGSFRGAYCLDHHFMPWWWRQYSPLKRLLPDHTALYPRKLSLIFIAVRTSHLACTPLIWHSERWSLELQTANCKFRLVTRSLSLGVMRPEPEANHLTCI